MVIQSTHLKQIKTFSSLYKNILYPQNDFSNTHMIQCMTVDTTRIMKLQT